MMRHGQQKGTQIVLWIITFITAMMICCGQPMKAQAQWSTPDANGNIYNTNSGNIGVGMGTTTSSGWGSSFRALQLGTDGYLLAWSGTAGNTGNDSMHIGQNSYFDGTNWRYQIGSFGAANYYQLNGTHGFRVAGSGTAGGTISWTTAMLINNSGNVGIGTTGPNYTLDVASSNMTRALSVVSSSTNHPVTLYAQTSASASAASIFVENNRGSFASYGGFYYGGSADGAGNLFGVARADRLFIFADGASNAGMAVGTFSAQPLILGTNNAERVRIDATGKVGIGTTNPQAALDVNGSINVSGNINAKFQDVAEWVPATHSLPAGTVVVLNPNQTNQVMASTSAYDTRVAGVVSAHPGVALGEASADKVLVATTGRVKVKVDATCSPIHVGDLLVTSDKEGMAMKSEPVMIQGRAFHSPGTLIGKALEPLAKGTGEILVLLSLQ